MDIMSFFSKVEAFKESSVILTAIELKLFDFFDENGQTAETIAEKAGITLRASSILLNALVALGLLTKKNENYFLSDFSKQFLVKSSPDYIGSLGHMVRLWQNWSQLPLIARNPEHIHELRKERNIEEFISAMHYHGLYESVHTMELLNLKAINHFVDVGCGSGVFGIIAKKLNPNLKVTFIDTPEVIRLTRQFCKEEGIKEGIEFLEGDFFEVPFPDNCGMIWLSSIIHIYDPETNIQLLKKAAKALRPGGEVVIRDFFLNPDRTSPKQAVMFAVNMLVNTTSGNTYTEEDIQNWMREAGLIFEKRILTEGKADLIVGAKT